MSSPESRLHSFVVSLLKERAAPDVTWWHHPAGLKRAPKVAAQLKNMGARNGVADICLVLPPEGRGAYLELKASKGSVSDDQEAFQGDVERSGALYAVARNPAQAMATLSEWGAINFTPVEA